MRRYSKLLAGASWMAEYGDPDKAEDWAFLQTYSAYHLAVPGRAYPPILLATSRKDADCAGDWLRPRCGPAQSQPWQGGCRGPSQPFPERGRVFRRGNYPDRNVKGCRW